MLKYESGVLILFRHQQKNKSMARSQVIAHTKFQVKAQNQ